MTTRKAGVLVAAFISTGIIGGAHADLIISNWNITGNTLTYNISGTIDAGVTIGSQNPTRLYIGVPGDTDWVIDNGVVSSAINHLGATRTLTTPRYLTAVQVGASDYTWLNATTATPFAPGDVLNASITAVGGTLIGANVNPLNIIVSAGRSAFPSTATVEPAYQVGAFQLIPEPASFSLLGLGVAFALGVRRFQSRASRVRQH